MILKIGGCQHYLYFPNSKKRGFFGWGGGGGGGAISFKFGIKYNCKNSG